MAQELPHELWAIVLKHVPQAERLERCALVNSKWHASAVAATSTLSVELKPKLQREHHQDQQQLPSLTDSLQSYLQRYGRHVKHIKVWSSSSGNNQYLEAPHPLLQLRGPELLSLDVSTAHDLKCELHLVPGSGLPGVLLDSVTSLTRLKLECCVLSGAKSITGLGALTSLRDLQLYRVRSWHQVRRDPLTLSIRDITTMEQLTRLSLWYVGIEHTHHVSQFAHLAVLSLSDVGPPSNPMTTQPQPRVLTLTPSISLGFVLPSTLVDLTLCNCLVFDAALLASTKNLTHLRLYGNLMLERQAGVCGGGSLLAAVADLKHLVGLELHNLDRDSDSVGLFYSRASVSQWPQPSVAFTALTASSKISKLSVRNCARGVWPHVFNPAQPINGLTSFAAVDGQTWGAEEVAQLVRCSPKLQSLELCLAATPDMTVSLAPLASSLTGLKLALASSKGLPTIDPGVLAAIAALTSLCSLDIAMTYLEPADTALLQLTSLTALTACTLAHSSAGGRRCIDIHNKVR